MLRRSLILFLILITFHEASGDNLSSDSASRTEAIPVDKSLAFKNWGVGGLSCDEYVKAREFPDSPVGPYDATFRQWLLGFTTAFNIMDPNTSDLFGKVRVEKAMNWMETYCRNNKSQEFFTAVWRFAEQAYARRTRPTLEYVQK